jgi:predicted  nucleic acid-binding Zn-ribbon protein
MATPAPHALLLHIALCDALIAHLEHHLHTITKQLQEQQVVLANAEIEHASEPKKLVAMKKAIDELELELRCIDDDLKQKTKQLDVVTAVKQQQALEHEIAMLIRKKESINDLQVDQWLAYEVAQQAQSLQSPLADEQLNKLRTSLQMMHDDISSTNAKLVEAHAEHATLAALFDEHWQTVYQRMKATMADPVVLVQKDACGGCFYPLQTAVLVRVRQQDVLSCTMCNRLLIYAPQPSPISPNPQ